MDGDSLTDRIRQARMAIRVHRDQRGDNRCWLDDYIVWAILPDSPDAPTEPPPFDEAMDRCRAFYAHRHDPMPNTLTDESITDPDRWDDDLKDMQVEDLVEAYARLLDAIRRHRDVAGDRTVSHDRALYRILPEQLPADFRLPPKEEFLGEAKSCAGCPNFWRSHMACQGPHDLHAWGPCAASTPPESH